MITAKFGGTAVTPRNLQKIKRAVGGNVCVVVSAPGKEHACDVKVTDLLRQAYFQLPFPTAFDGVCAKFRNLVERNGVDVDVDRLLHGALSRLKRCDSVQYAMSLGEELSAKIVAQYLNLPLVDAEKAVFFRGGKLLYGKTLKELRSAFGGCGGVIAGFYGSDGEGRSTFSRGGSDVTGALVANATDSVIYENFTDVNGVCVADPHKVAGVATAPCLSYAEMYLLARAGATVLHPSALRPVAEKAIATRISNYNNLFAPSTLVSNSPSLQKILGLAERNTRRGVASTLLFNAPQREIAEALSQFLQSQSVIEAQFTRRTLKILTEHSVLSQLYRHLPVD